MQSDAGEQIFAYIESIDPTTVCTQFGACVPGQLFSNMSVPPLPPALVAKAAAVRMHAHELSATNDFCDTCKMVIVEAASILGNLVRSPSNLPLFLWLPVLTWMVFLVIRHKANYLYGRLTWYILSLLYAPSLRHVANRGDATAAEGNAGRSLEAVSGGLPRFLTSIIAK